MREYLISEIDIEKLYYLSDIKIKLNSEKRQHLLLTGKNGSGKTQLLLKRCLVKESDEMDREYILRLLRAQINVNGHIIGAAVGSGMTAKFAAMGGADLLLALSAGKYRIMGRSSFASYFVMEIVMSR